MEKFIHEKESYKLSIFIYTDTVSSSYQDINNKHKWAML